MTSMSVPENGARKAVTEMRKLGKDGNGGMMRGCRQMISPIENNSKENEMCERSLKCCPS